MNTYKCKLVVVGPVHPPTIAQLVSDILADGNVIVKLSHEPKNKYDSNAVSVWYLGQRVGYLPNQGQYCTMCYKKSSKDFSKCKLGWCLLKDGGLATMVVDQLDSNVPVAAFATRYENDGDGYQITIEINWADLEIF